MLHPFDVRPIFRTIIVACFCRTVCKSVGRLDSLRILTLPSNASRLTWKLAQIIIRHDAYKHRLHTSPMRILVIGGPSHSCCCTASSFALVFHCHRGLRADRYDQMRQACSSLHSGGSFYALMGHELSQSPYTLIPQLLARPRPLPAMKLAYCPSPPIAPPTFCTSLSRRSRKSEVAAKSADLSVVMNTSELEYTPAREALLEYQLKSTLVSPARYHISSVNAFSSFRLAGILPSKLICPSAPCQQCIISLFALRRSMVRILIFRPKPSFVSGSNCTLCFSASRSVTRW